MKTMVAVSPRVTLRVARLSTTQIRMASTMKRKATSATSASPGPSASKKHVKQETASDGSKTVARLSAECPEWPAPTDKMEQAVGFLRRCAASGEKVLLVPDKDADGLDAGVIMYRTLTEALAVDPGLVAVHLMTKGSHPSATEQRNAMAEYGAKWIIVLDQGSRNAPALVPGAEHGWNSESDQAVHTMVVDHHFLPKDESGPQGCLMLNACHHEPVATAALLTWVLCRPLWQHNVQAEKRIDYLAVLGTMGDLSVNVSWDAPFPDMADEIKKWSKKRLGSAIALLNAPRRTPDFDVDTAWQALLASNDPLSILDPAVNVHAQRLYEARDAVGLETERCTHTPPKFAKDGRVALLSIKSAYQVHPSIATRWTGALKSKNLQVVMCANSGYSPGLTNFSCRIAQVAKKRGEQVNIIDVLNSYADQDPDWKQELMRQSEGNSLFNGHIQASGGIFEHHHFAKLCELMQIGVPPDDSQRAATAKSAGKPTQKNNLLAMGFSTSPKKTASTK